MKTKIAAAVVTLAALASGCNQKGGDQAKPICLVAHGAFAVNYFVKAGQPAGCEALTLEAAGFQRYSPDRAKPGNLAISPEAIAANVGLNELTTPFALGTFTTNDPDASDLCKVPTFQQPATIGEGAEQISYTYSNVEFYVTAASPGTQVKGEVAVTSGGTTCGYTFYGMYPAVGCAEDADCNPVADPATQRYTGSGINPDFPTKCNTDVGYCQAVDAPGSSTPRSDFVK